jgi:RNA chaperone Hfq
VNPTSSTAPQQGTPSKKPFVAKGHDAQLQDAQRGNFEVRVMLMSGGDLIVGTIVKRDKFTITLRQYDTTGDLIIYKHAIETIAIVKS